MRDVLRFSLGLAMMLAAPIASPAAAARGADRPAPALDDRLDDARAALRAVLAGDLSALDRAQAGFEAGARGDGRDPLAMAYLGEVLAIRAWHAADPREADALADRAVALADRAQTLARAAGSGAPRLGEVPRVAAFACLTVARLEVMRVQLGEAAAVARAEALLERTEALSPGDPLVLAYRGMVLVVRSGAAPSEQERGELAARGLVLLDRALAVARATGPDGLDREVSSAEARLVAAGTFIALPDAVFHRFDQGLSLLQAELASPGLERLPPRLRAHLHHQASLAARRQGRSADERAHLRAYAAIAPGDDPLAPLVRARLAEVGP